MIVRITRLTSIAALLGAAAFWSYASDYQSALRFLVSVGALLAAGQAVRVGKHRWVAAFYGVAVLFNPFWPLFTPPGRLALFLVLGTALMFAASLFALKLQPLLSIPSTAGGSHDWKDYQTRN